LIEVADMYCPGCGLNNSEQNQYCRSCGTELRAPRSVLTKVEGGDKIAASAMFAREEIGRAIAAKIRTAKSASELSTIAEEVLPQIEKFLEPPEARRLRRIRAGSLITFIGLGAAVGFSVASTVMGDEDIIMVAVAGLVTFFIGIALVVNGLFFTIPKSDALPPEAYSPPEDKPEPAGLDPKPFRSVTDSTTRNLES
jgi:hypothetical protein